MNPPGLDGAASRKLLGRLSAPTLQPVSHSRKAQATQAEAAVIRLSLSNKFICPDSSKMPSGLFVQGAITKKEGRALSRQGKEPVRKSFPGPLSSRRGFTPASNNPWGIRGRYRADTRMSQGKMMDTVGRIGNRSRDLTVGSDR